MQFPITWWVETYRRIVTWTAESTPTWCAHRSFSVCEVLHRLRDINHRGNESHYLWEAFIMRFVAWRLEILAKFQNDSVTWRSNDRCSWDVFIMPWYHAVRYYFIIMYVYGIMGLLYQQSAWVSDVARSWLNGQCEKPQDVGRVTRSDSYAFCL